MYYTTDNKSNLKKTSGSIKVNMKRGRNILLQEELNQICWLMVQGAEPEEGARNDLQVPKAGLADHKEADP